MKTANETTLFEVFRCLELDVVLDCFAPKEIVESIEEYEAEKNHIAETDKKVEPKFNVGDYVKTHYSGYGHILVFREDGKYAVVEKTNESRVLNYTDSIEHAEPPKEEKDCEDCKHYAKDQYSVPCCFCVSHHEKFEPKEEKQKIEKLEVYYDGFSETQMKINELVNAVNELRGV